MSIRQRALWTFLFFTLAGPLLAGLVAALYVPFAIWANTPPFTAGDHGTFDPGNLPDGAGLAQIMAASAVRAFVWAPVATALAAAGTVGILLLRGEVGWALAGVSGVIGFFVMYVIAPFAAGDLLPAFALVAGAIASILCLFLVRIGVLPTEL